MESPAPPPPVAAVAAPSPLAGLPPELLQRCFSFLEDDSRQAVLDVSRGWHAALAAAPGLVPTARLSCVLDAEDEEEEEAGGQMGGTMPGKGGPMPCPACTHTACGTLRAAMEQLRQLSPRTLQVRLEGFDWSLDRAYYDRKDPGHNLLPDALQQLPSGLTALELNSFCTVAVPAALARFTRLQRLALTGNTRDVAWADPAAAALMPLLRDVRLDYCSRAQVPACWGGNFQILPSLPDSDASALAAASRLERLHFIVNRWSDNILELCEALPALRELSLDLLPETEAYTEISPHRSLRLDIPPAVAALHRLTCLTALSLATGATLHLTWPDGEDDDEDQPRDVQLPPLAGLTALTELQLRWLALPPPDWRQLSNLRRLGMRYSVDWEGEPLTGLVSLTHFSGYRKSLPEEAHNLARLPHLASVQAPKFGPKWRKQVEALLPHLAFIEERW